jgi:hypothetical protein
MGKEKFRKPFLKETIKSFYYVDTWSAFSSAGGFVLGAIFRSSPSVSPFKNVTKLFILLKCQHSVGHSQVSNSGNHFDLNYSIINEMNQNE